MIFDENKYIIDKLKLTVPNGQLTILSSLLQAVLFDSDSHL